MFGLFKNNAEIDAFAVETCRDLNQRFPRAREEELGDRNKAGKALGKALDDMQARFIQFQHERDLSVYGKARLLQAVREELRRLQYSDKFIQAITELLVPATAAKVR
jgi:hypothetical protein